MDVLLCGLKCLVLNTKLKDYFKCFSAAIWRKKKSEKNPFILRYDAKYIISFFIQCHLYDVIFIILV